MIQQVAKEEMVMTEVQVVLEQEQGAQVLMSHLVVLQVLLVVQETVETVEVLLLLRRQKLTEHN
jgi:ATP-dependent RNA circularization protein (DNA/RNA ligase family)